MAKPTTSKSGKKAKSGKKKLPVSFFIIVICFFFIPVAGLVGWYFMTAGLAISGSKLSPTELIAERVAKAQSVLKNNLEEQAKIEGFQLEKALSCIEMLEEYNITEGEDSSEAINRKLLGLPVSATYEQVSSRCVTFAKVVKRMEKLSHHNKHVFMCQNASFTMDKSGRYNLVADSSGRGIVETFDGIGRLIEIPKGRHAIVRKWQIFNLGDGCVVIGLSSYGNFSYANI